MLVNELMNNNHNRSEYSDNLIVTISVYYYNIIRKYQLKFTILYDN